MPRNIGPATKVHRLTQLRAILESRREELVNEVQNKIRDVRTGQLADQDVLDGMESSEVSIQHDIGLALIQMKAETLARIDAALRRIDDGSYGDCFECGDEIAEARLRALPFAVRCRACEERREATDGRERAAAQRRSSPLGWVP